VRCELTARLRHRINEKSMKRFHVLLSVQNIQESVRFYSALFSAPPVVIKSDYAKWMLDDPRVNFAISERTPEPGIRHLGIQVEDSGELQEVYGRLKEADRPVLEEGATTCCYARSEKSWIEDPQGVKWETFLTTGESTVYGTDEPQMADGCCEPQAIDSQRCCEPSTVTVAPPKTRCCG
jgi:catechol 2,3-dioxygenase-like lactoylglutathione lyase family enzyme